MTYQPKASMCMSCAKLHDNCTHLPFSAMPPMSKSKGRIIVKCTEHEHARQAASSQADRRAGSAWAHTRYAAVAIIDTTV